MDGNHPKRVEDYTTASLILVFVNLIWILGVIWANFGILVVILTAWVLNHMITRLERHRASREIKWPSDA